MDQSSTDKHSGEVGRKPAGDVAPSGRHLDSPYLAGLRYAPGLDGIRAIAVAAVVLYHAHVAWLPGGFLGVDVFFVLSGYLITSLLLAEHRRSDRVDLVRFWLGRARRLLPAAVLVIVVCLAIVAVFLPGELATLRGDGLASLFYVSNWHQILAQHSYFTAFGRPSLLQHYWSLAVEEQFYLVWPVLMAAGLLASRRRWVLAGAVLAGVLSAGLMALLYHQGSDPSRVYYGTDTRAAPLMIGAIMAFAWPLGRMTGRVGRGATTWLDGAGLAGLGVLMLAMQRWHDFDPFLYPGGFVLAALAAAGVIGVAGHPASRLGRALSVRPLRWIGQRSYGIYLWHWPVIALTRPGIDLSWSPWILVPSQIAATLALASLSYRYVEMPFRRGTALGRVAAWLAGGRPHRRFAGASTIAATVVGLIALVGFAPSTSSSSERGLRASAAVANPLIALPQPDSAVRRALIRRPPRARRRELAGGRVARRGVGRVLAVGASVMAAAAPALAHRLGARVDAAVGRQPSAIIDRLQAYRDAGRLPPTVVVQIGDNGPVWSADLTRLHRVLSGVSHVVLVNVREPASDWQGEVNDALAQVVRSWPTATVADWLSASANPDLLYDGAHPDPAGQAAYAAVVARALER